MSTVRRTDAPRRPAPVTSEILDRKPPFDLDAELAVIGSMMLLQDVTDDIALILRPDDTGAVARGRTPDGGAGFGHLGLRQRWQAGFPGR